MNFLHLITLIDPCEDISLSSDPFYPDALQFLNEWNVFKSRRLHFIHLNINILLSKIEELQYIAKFTDAAIIGNL